MGVLRGAGLQGSGILGGGGGPSRARSRAGLGGGSGGPSRARARAIVQNHLLGSISMPWR